MSGCALSLYAQGLRVAELWMDLETLYMGPKSLLLVFLLLLVLSMLLCSLSLLVLLFFSFGVIMWKCSSYLTVLCAYFWHSPFQINDKILTSCCNNHFMIIYRIDIQTNTWRFQSLFRVRDLPGMKSYIQTSIGWTMSWFFFFFPFFVLEFSIFLRKLHWSPNDWIKFPCR